MIDHLTKQTRNKSKNRISKFSKNNLDQSNQIENSESEFDFIRSKLYGKQKGKEENESPERKESLKDLIARGEKSYRNKQKSRSSNLKKKKSESNSVVIKKKTLLNKSSRSNSNLMKASKNTSVKKAPKTPKKSKKRGKSKYKDKTEKRSSRKSSTKSKRKKTPKVVHKARLQEEDSSQSNQKINSRYDEEMERHQQEEEGLVSMGMKKRFIDSREPSEDSLEKEYVTFTSKLAKRKKSRARPTEKDRSSKNGKKKSKKESKRLAKESIQTFNQNFKVEEEPRTKNSKGLKNKSKRVIKQQKLLKEESLDTSLPELESVGLVLKSVKQKKPKKAKKKKKKNISPSNSERNSEADLEELEDSNFLRGKSLWGEELDKPRIKSKSEVKSSRKKQKDKRKNTRKSEQQSNKRLKKDPMEGFCGEDTLPLKNDTLDKFAKLQKRSNLKKKKTARNNSLVSLRSALSKKSKH